MQDKIFYIFICLLALYGALTLIYAVIGYIGKKQAGEIKGATLVLIVKDEENRIEGIIRKILGGTLLRKMMVEERLTVIDMASSDDTPNILAKLKRYYENLDVLKEEELGTFMEEFKLRTVKKGGG